jgi:hypothetical protein
VDAASKRRAAVVAKVKVMLVVFCSRCSCQKSPHHSKSGGP